MIFNTNRTLLIFFTLFIFGCNDLEQEKKETTEEVVPVGIFESVAGTYTNEVEFAGTFFANREANVGSSMPGKIEKYHYKPGQYVEKGAVVAEMSAELLTQAIIEYEAILKNYHRISRLRERGSVSQMEYDNLKAKLEASDAKTQMIKNNTTIKAPFSGIIVEYLIEQGENYFFNINLEPGYSHTSGIFRLMQLNPLKVIISVNENELKYINEGSQVRIICTAIDSDNYLIGRVSYIKPILSTLTRTAEVEIILPNPGNKILPGMFAKVIFESETISGVKIPLNAIYRQPGTPNDYVFVIKDNIAKRVPVERVKVIDDMVFVEGIEQGLEVVTHGKNQLNCGSKVKIVQQ